MSAIQSWRWLAAAGFAVVCFAGCSDRGNVSPATQVSNLQDDDESDDDSNLVRVPGAGAVLAPNEAGVGRTVTPTRSIDTGNLFFRSIGINGRACVSCHVASQGWTVTPAGLRDRFERTNGRDPVFRTNDGSNSPLADVSTVEARRNAYSMLLRKGLIRVG